MKTGAEKTERVTDLYVTFEIQEHRFAIAAADVQRIVPASASTPYAVPPRMPEYVICVAKLLEQPILVVDLLRLLKLGDTPDDFPLAVILTKCKGSSISIAVYSVGIVPVAEEDLWEDAETGIRVAAVKGEQYRVLDAGLLFE